MGPKERREREREEIRIRILDAARDLFVRHGYEAVTMRAIAEKIEYSPTAIYLHFPDKESLLKSVCDSDFLALAKQFATIAEIADPIEKLRRTGQAYVEFGVRNPNHYRLMFMTPHPPMDPKGEQVEKGNPEEDAYAFLKMIVQQGLAEGRFRPGLTDVEILSQTVWAAVHGVISLEIAKHNDPWVDWRPLARRTRLMLDTMVDGITLGARGVADRAGKSAAGPRPAMKPRIAKRKGA